MFTLVPCAAASAASAAMRLTDLTYLVKFALVFLESHNYTQPGITLQLIVTLPHPTTMVATYSILFMGLFLQR